MDVRWVVESIEDKGPSEWYRYHVTGWIEDNDREPVRFSWAVPSIANRRFVFVTEAR